KDWNFKMDEAAAILLNDKEIKFNDLKENAEVTVKLPNLPYDIESLSKEIEKAHATLRESERDQNWKDLIKLIGKQKTVVTNLYRVKTLVGFFSIPVTPFNVSWDAGVAFAGEHRRNLMKKEARGVDAWLKTGVTANLLRSQLNITGTANLAAPPLSLNPVG